MAHETMNIPCIMCHESVGIGEYAGLATVVDLICSQVAGGLFVVVGWSCKGRERECVFRAYDGHLGI